MLSVLFLSYFELQLPTRLGKDMVNFLKFVYLIFISVLFQIWIITSFVIVLRLMQKFFKGIITESKQHLSNFSQVSPKKIFIKLVNKIVNLFKPPKLWVTIFGFSLISFLSWLLPSFIFNELEFQFRNQVMGSYYLINRIDKPLEFRKSALLDIIDEQSSYSIDDFFEAGQFIEHDIEDYLLLLNEALTTINKQQKIPFLGSKYRQYLKEKQHSFEEYRRVTEFFLTMKQNQHMYTNTVVRFSWLDMNIQKALRQETTWEENISLFDIYSKKIKNDNEILFSRNYISESLYHKITTRNQLNIFFHKELLKVKEEKSWDNFDAAGFIAISEANANWFDYLNEANERTEEVKTEYNQMQSAVDERLYKLGDYYNDNNLAFDKLSILLSKLSWRYPKNNFEKGTPIFLPADSNFNLISWRESINR